MNIYQETIRSFEAHQQLLRTQVPSLMRPWSQAQSLKNDRGVIILGPRGVGKTTFLLKEANGRGLYISADHPLMRTVELWRLGEEVFRSGYDLLVVDEVHYFNKDWSRDIKALYDSHPGKQIWISDSSSLVLRKGSGDLSRRFPKIYMPLLSFREYMSLTHEKNFPTFNPFLGESPHGEWNSFPPSKLLENFHNYLNSGMRPFFFEERYGERTLAIIEKMIFTDVPFFVDSIQANHLSLMNAVLTLLSKATVPTINIESLSREWGVGKAKIYELLSVMDALELITIVRKKTDHSLGKGAKMLLADPSWYAVLMGNVGSQREAFVAAMLRAQSLPCYASDDDATCDFVTPWGLVEVGGAQKKVKKAKFAIRDDIYAPTPTGGIPLWMVGCLY